MTDQPAIPEAEVVEEKVEHAPGQQLAERGRSGGLWRTDEPDEVLARATATANTLKAALRDQKMVVPIQGREHVTVDGWQTVGQMLGVTAVMDDKGVIPLPWPESLTEALTKLRDEGKTYGYRAHYRAMTLDGRVIGAAEALCSRQEKTWANRDDYALDSMAQTRAISKCLKGVLGFVVTLAGFTATPAEEMPENAAGAVAPASEDVVRHAKRSLAYLLNRGQAGEVTEEVQEKALEVWLALQRDGGGQVPRTVANALLKAGEALAQLDNEDDE